MPQIAILAAIEIGLGVAQSFLMPKPKQTPVDRGRLDDLRIQTAEEGTILPRFYGKRVRVAGNIIDGERTREFKVSTGGSSGNKKGQGATPPTTNYSYKKTFAIAWGEGPIRAFRQIKDGDQIIYNLGGASEDTTGYYQAEDGTLAGGATIVSDPTCAGGRRVDLPPGGSVTFPPILKNLTETTAVVIYYKCTAAVAVTIRHNGVDDPTTAPNSSGALIASIPINYTLPAGSNEIKVTNTSGSASISIDRLFAFPGFTAAAPGTPPDRRRTTEVVDPDNPYPADANDPQAYYNYAPFADGTGTITGQISSGGQSNFELYNGTEDQPQSPTLLALSGRSADNTPAYRGLVLSVFNQYVIQNGTSQLGNFTAEIEPWFSDLADILTDMYSLDGAAASEMDFTRVAGTEVDGFVYDRRDSLAPYVQALCDFYGFDVVPIDGKIVAIPRGGAAVLTIPEDELYGREEGSEIAKGPVSIDHISDSDIPGAVDVQALDPSSEKEFHTIDRRVGRQVGNSLDPETLVFPLVSDGDTLVAIGKRWLYEKKLSAKPLRFATGPRYRHLVPTDVINVQTSAALYKVRLTSAQAGFSGMVKFGSVPEKGALYSQVGSGAAAAGTEIPPVAYPANTFLWLGDLPPLRLEDDRLGYYAAVCPRGIGSWRGAHFFKEIITDNWQRLTAFAAPAMIGVLAADMAAITDTLPIDAATQMMVNFYFDDGSIESRTVDEILARPVSQVIIGSGSSAEVLRFATQAPQSYSDPYRGKYLFTNLLRGLNGTEEAAKTGHTAGVPVVVLSEAVQFIQEDPAELQRTRSFAVPTVGQALPDAITQATDFTFQGYSKKPLSVTGIKGYRTPAGDAIVEWVRRVRVGGVIKNLTGVPVGEERLKTLVEILSGGNPIYSTLVEGGSAVSVPWAQVATPDLLNVVEAFRSVIPLNPYSSFIEATMAPDSWLNIRDSTQVPGMNDNPFWQIFVDDDLSATPDTTLGIIENGVAKFSKVYSGSVSVRPRFRVLNGVALFYDDYKNEDTVPVYQSNKHVPDLGPLIAGYGYFASGGGLHEGSITKAVFAGQEGLDRVVLPAALQTALFGSPQALGTMTVRVTQYSALVGPGAPATGLV
jgi:putative tail protein